MPPLDLPTPPTSNTCPRAFGRFRILRRLGAGGYGVVYEAFDPICGVVALKIPHPSHPDAHQRLQREADALARLKTPYVCRLYDMGDVDGRPYLAMERLQGSTLFERIRDHGPLDALDILDLTEGLAHAALSLERAGVVHRDLKPENIILRDDHLRSPVLIDFGISRLPQLPGLTDPSILSGTPGYVAPESILGHDPDHRSDLFVLGMALRFAATGTNFMAGHPSIRVLSRMAEETVPIPPTIPLPIRVFLERLTDLDPQRRPSAQGLLQGAQKLRRHRCSECFHKPTTPSCARGHGCANSSGERTPAATNPTQRLPKNTSAHTPK